LASNYRPISLLNIFEKLLEKVIYERLISFLIKHNVLNQSQCGFRKNHSTALALLEVLDNIYSKSDKHETVVGIFLDLQKAFDTVNHEILLYKLHSYGIRGVMHSWFASYLTNRLQFTSVDNVNSGLAMVNCGVPKDRAGPAPFPYLYE